MRDGRATCYAWDEAKRSACEIATCLSKQITSICTNPHVEDITFYSDTCTGQNRNQYVAGSLFYSLTQHKNIQRINHTFFERGHSQMENDSVHSAIETDKKKTHVYVPSQWHTVITLARRRDPYVVIPIKHDGIDDFKTFTSKHCPNMKNVVTGERVNWLKVKWIQVRRNEETSIFLNYSFDIANSSWR